MRIPRFHFAFCIKHFAFFFVFFVPFVVQKCITKWSKSIELMMWARSLRDWRSAEWRSGPAIGQSDRYFAHPSRDFARTDEALRIRTVGASSFVTYKGPKIDVTTKTRRELELPLDPGDADGSQFAELLTALGFTPVAVVRKQRCPFHIDHAGRRVEGGTRRSRRRGDVCRAGAHG